MQTGNLDVYQSRVVVAAIDAALSGSEYGVEAWQLIRRHLLSGTSIPLNTWNRIAELTDHGADDVLGPGLRCDLSRDRLYK